MNTKYIYKISNYLFICMLALAVFACKDDDNSEDTSALTRVSSNITEGATLESNSGYVELTFNKKVRQAPNTSITFNDADIRIMILNKVTIPIFRMPLMLFQATVRNLILFLLRMGLMKNSSMFPKSSLSYI